MKVFFFLLSVLGTVNIAFADEMIFYKYAESPDKYATFVVPASQNIQSQMPPHIIARKLQNAHFELEFVSKEFYEIKETKDVVFFGERVTQYDITPRSQDRFSHTVWVDSSGRLVKTETFNIASKLMFAFAVFDIENDKSRQTPKKEKFEKTKTKDFYKGFRQVFSKMMPDGVLHVIFMDGINKFSVFINPFPEHGGEVKKIMYGNNLCSKTISGVEYTVLGSLPYSEIESIIEIFAVSKQQVLEAFENGTPITEDIYKTHDTNGGNR